jgi:hypothetical protein
MEPSQKHALELALRYFYIPDDVHLTVTDRLRFDWLLQQPLASWQFLTLQEFRSREFVPPKSQHVRAYICVSYFSCFFVMFVAVIVSSCLRTYLFVLFVSFLF